MKCRLVLFCVAFTPFFLSSHSIADSATTIQTLAIQVPEVNLLDIPENVYLDLTMDEDGYYSGSGQFTYAITTNVASDSTKKKRITANLSDANFGDQGRLVITMTAPSTLSTHMVSFHQGETNDKVLVDSISNVVAKEVALSITLEKLSLAAVNAYIDPITMNVRYPVKINYKLSYE